MKKLLLFFLTIISAVCLCAGFSACGLLEELSSGEQNVEQGSSDGGETEEEGSSGDEGTEEDTSGDSGTEEESSGDSSTEQDTSDGEETEEDTSGDSGTEEESSGDSGTEEGSSGDSGTEEGSSGDSGTEEGSSGDSGTEEDASGDSDSEEESSGDSGSEESGETEVTFTAREGNSTYGYYQLAEETNGAEMQSLYYQMYTACETFITSESDVAVTSGYYKIAEISYGGYSLTTDEAISVWEVFYLENPVYYWLSNNCRYTGSVILLCIDEAYASYAQRAVYDEEISTMFAEACELVAQIDGELEKAMAIHDYIIAKIDYAYQSDGVTPETAIWAHNITGVSSKGAGVCEAYSKTYLALCLINGLDCVIATGNASSSGEAHAWNLVKIDGAWYGVDCTWDDTGDDNDLSYVYFGMNASAINSTRTTDDKTYGISYLYDLPEVTAYAIQPVTLFKGETQMGTYVNVDAAFAAMTDSEADYTIEFYFYNSAGTLVYTSPATTVYIYSDGTPAVNGVTINGVYSDQGNGYFYVSYLTMPSKFTLNCNLTISDIILTATELNLGEYTLSTGGYYCRLNGTIYDEKTADAISINAATTSQTDIYADLNVSYYYGRASINGTAVIGTYYGSHMLMVYGTLTIENYISANQTNYYNIYLEGGATLSVNNLVYDSDGANKKIYILIQFDEVEEYPALYMGNVEAKTYLYISGYISATEAATPSDLDCAIATLGSADDFANISIYYGSDNKTSLYSVNADNEIVYGKA